MAQDSAQNNTPTNAATGTTTPTTATENTPIANGTGPAAVKGVDMGMIVDTTGPNINPAALEASARIQAQAAQPAQANAARPVAYTPVKFGQVETLNKPAAGKTVTVQADPGEQFKVNFDPDSAQLSVRNGDLVFTFNDGAQIVVDHFVMASNQMPSLMLPDGTLLAGGVIVAQLTGQSADDLFNIETAAGPAAGNAFGGGNTIYSDDLGRVIGLLDKLPPILFGELAQLAAPERQPLPLIQVIDNVPPGQPNVFHILDETDGYTGNTQSGQIVPDFGGDGPGTITLSPNVSAGGSMLDGQLTSNGEPVLIQYNNNTITGVANGQAVFTINVQPDGTYTFELLGQLDHNDPNDPNDVINLNFTYIVSDADGDTGTGQIVINVKDDAPIANDDTNSVKDNGSVNGNVVTGFGQPVGGADDLSNDDVDAADPFYNNVVLTIKPANGPEITFFDNNGNLNPAVTTETDNNGNERYFVTVQGQYGTLKIYADGDYTYTHTKGTGELVDVFSYKLFDGDGDSDPANLTINISDGVPTIPETQGEGRVDESFDLSKTITGPISYTNGTSVATGDQAGTGQFIAEGSMTNNALTSNGQTVSVSLVNGVYVGYIGADPNAQGAKVFEFSVNGNQYSFKQYSNLDHADGSNANDIISLKFAVTASDADGDKATGMIKIDVLDDAPVANPDTNTVNVVVHEFNVIGGAPDFPTLQEQTNLPDNQPALFAQGVAKASDVVIDFPTTVMIDRLQAGGNTTIFNSPLFAFTQDANGNITNVKLLFGDANSNPSNTSATHAEYTMSGTGHLGFFIARSGTDALKSIGAIDAAGNIQPGFEFKLSADGSKIQYVHNGQTNDLMFNATDALEPAFGGSFLGRSPYGVAGRESTDPANVLRYGFEDRTLGAGSDKDYNDVQFKVTIQPTSTETALPVSGNVLPNDVVGQDDILGLQYGTKVTQAASGDLGSNNPFVTMATPTGQDAGGKFVSIQGEYGLLKIYENGQYTYTYNTGKKDGDLVDEFRYTMIDNDGDTSTTTLKIDIRVSNDYVPTVDATGGAINEQTLLVPGVDSIVREITIHSQDGVSNIALTTTGLPALQSGGQPVTYTVSPDGKTLTGTAGGNPVFTVVLGTPVQQQDGSYKAPYTFTLLQQLDNPGTGQNTTSIPVKFVVTDGDNDTSTGTLPLQVIDDVPAAAVDVKAMGTTTVATGNVITNDAFGADGFNPANSKVTSVTYAGVTKTFATPDAVISFTTPKGTLEIKGDGSYTFTRNASLGDLNEVFNYKITDRDGDESTTTLTISGNDNPVIIVTPHDPAAGGEPATLDEDDLPVPGPDFVEKEITFTAPDGLDYITILPNNLPTGLTSGGLPLSFEITNGGKTLTAKAGNETVFTVVIGTPVVQQDGSFKAPYTFTLMKPIDNPGTGENITDIPVKFAVYDKDGDSAMGTLPLKIIDDVPSAVSETVGMGTQSVATGNILTNGDTFGADGFNPANAKVTSITYGGVTKTFATPTSEVSFTTPGGTLNIKGDGSYTFTRNSSLGNLNEVFAYKITDRDGDTSDATLTITGNDNPVIIVTPDPQNPYAGGNPAVLDEDDLPVPGVDAVTKDVTFTAPDGVQSVVLTTTGLPALTSGGLPVTYALSPDGKTLTGSAGGQPVFTVVLGNPVQQQDGSYKAPYTFTLLKPLDNPGTGENVTNIPVKFIATDLDGDNATGTLPLSVIDDVPFADLDYKVMGTATVATGNVITNDTFGADGANPANSKVTSITYGGVTKTFATPDAVVSFITPKGTLEIKGDGSYTFTRNASLGDLNEVFTYKITDRDGDTSETTLTITGNDNPVIIVTPHDPAVNGEPAILDEDDLPVPGVDSVTKEITFTAPDGVQSAVLTTNGLPALTSGGLPVTYALSPDGKTLTGSAGGQPVFTVVLGTPVLQQDQSYKAPYTFTLLKPLDNPGTGENVTSIPVKFVVTDLDGDNATGTLPLSVIDDVPVAVSESVAMGTTTVATGNILSNGDTYGADGFNPANAKVTTITYAGTTKTFDTPTSEVSFTTPKGTLVIKADGSYTFTRNATLGDLNENFTYKITDRDGDTSEATLTITGNDNPVIIVSPSVNGQGVILDEDDLPVPGVDQAVNTITFTAPDGAKSIVLSTDGLPSLTSGGQPVTYMLSADGKVLTGSANGSPVFTVVLADAVKQADNVTYKANYTFTLYQPLDNPGAGENITNIPVKFIATDTDGDSAGGTLPLQVIDDVPVANDDVNSVANHGTVNGNILTGAGQTGGADVMSADTPTTITTISFGGTTKSFANPADVQTDGNGSFITINGQYGTLKLYSTGNYAYTHTNGSGALVDQFNYVIRDRDGDTDPATLTINIANGVPTIPALQGDKFLDETNQLNTDITGAITSTGATIFTLGAANGAALFEASGSILGGGALLSNGQPVNVQLIGGKYVGFTGSDPNAANAKVFEVSLNGSNYTYKQFSNIDHADGSNPNDVISLKFGVTVADADGDKATGMIKIDVLDDAPIVRPDENSLTINLHQYNVNTNAPDFPSLQEYRDLPSNNPGLFAQGVAKASNVQIDYPTTIIIDRMKSGLDTTNFKSPLFAFTQDANGNIVNIKLIFASAGSDNDNDNAPTHAEYQMTTPGKLGFFLAGAGTNALISIGAVDANGNINPNFTFSLQENAQGQYEIHYSNNAQSGVLLWDNADPLVARFAGDFDGQDIHGIAGRMTDDPSNVLRYGFEDMSMAISDKDYNDVQIKVTINPTVVEIAPPITGNVLPNDTVGQDDIQGLQYGTKVVQVSLDNGAFSALNSGQDAGGKFITIQGEYGVLKMYENGQYSYDYNTGKKDGDLKDVFNYKIIDNDGDISASTTLTIAIGVQHTSSDVSAGGMLSPSPAPLMAASVMSEPSVETTQATGLWDPNGDLAMAHTKSSPKDIPVNWLVGEDSDIVARETAIDGRLAAVSEAGLGHLGDKTILSASEGLTSHGEAIKTALEGHTLHGYTGDSFANRTSDVFTLELQQNGNYRFDLKESVDQASAKDTLLSFDYHAKDESGSVVEGQIMVGLRGDQPTTVTQSGGSLTLDDVFGAQDGHHAADTAGFNSIAAIDIINSIIDKDHNDHQV